MKTLYIAIGNTLRGDDGVSHYILDRLEPRAGEIAIGVFQLTPEIAPEVARAETVIFIDADVDAIEPSIDPIATNAIRGTPLAHSLTPAEIVCLAERLYGFAGQAYLCRVPVASFDGEQLSPVAEAAAEGALALLREEIRV